MSDQYFRDKVTNVNGSWYYDRITVNKLFEDALNAACNRQIVTGDGTTNLIAVMRDCYNCGGRTVKYEIPQAIKQVQQEYADFLKYRQWAEQGVVHSSFVPF